MSNVQIGSLQNNYFSIGSTGQNYAIDTYFFSLPTMGSTRISAEGFSGDINMELQNKAGKIIKSISTSNTNAGIINIDNLGAADYILKISPVSGYTNYQVSLTPEGKVDPLTGMGVDAGFFVADKKGKVSFDFLNDGGKYQGEIAIFSLHDMEKFTSSSREFIKEVAKRSLSDSVLGKIVISEFTEGANPLFRGSLGEENYNNEPYKGVKTFDMTPGTAFAIMLVPNGKVQDVFDNPDIGGNKRPLFSLSSLNPNDAWLYGQIADVTGAGLVFSIEDQRVDMGSDGDYQDVIFKLTGATGKAVLLNEVINPAKDWTTSVGGKKFIDFLNSTPPENTVPKDLQFEVLTGYTVGDQISFTGGKVYDADGVDNLTKVEFSKRKEGGEWVKVSNAETFTADSQGWANFSYSLSELSAGNYEVKAIAYDAAGDTSNTVIKSFTVKDATPTPTPTPTPPTPTPTPTNTAPKNLQFDVLTTYQVGETISFTGGKVYDADGVDNLKRVEISRSKEGGEWVKVSNAETFTADNPGWASFSYSLSELSPGNYEVKAIAYDEADAPSNTVIKSFTVKDVTPTPTPTPIPTPTPTPTPTPVNQSPENLQFSLLTTYKPKEAIQLTNTKIFDANGVNNLAKVDFWLQKEGGEWTDIRDATTFTPDSVDNRWATFNYTVNELVAGKYKLKAIAYDKLGAASNEVMSNFSINTAPNDLEFKIYSLYTTGEQLSFIGATVMDAEGVSDVDRVDFWLQKEGGEKIDIANDVTQFESDSDGVGRFNFSYDLSQLTPGRYQLKAIAYDKAGGASEVATEKFALITNPGESGLSDEVKLAIVGAANLDSYPPEALAATREWVVWLTPGQSSEQLAASVGAIDRGDTGHIPNTFIWEFPQGIAPQEVPAQLATVAGLEYAYPQVPVSLRLLHEPQETLYKDQWNLQNANLPAAWDVVNPATSQTVRGRGVTIGIVDDGLLYNHPDLRSRYNAGSSWDFTDRDSDPSPTSTTSFVANLSQPKVNSWSSIAFSMPVNLTGMVIGVNASFDLSQSLPPNLPKPEGLQVFLYSPDASEFSGFYRRASFGARLQWPGRDDLKFTQRAELKFTGNSSQSFILNQFNGSYAGGNWQLEIKNPNPDEYDADEMRQLSEELLKRWTLQINTANPHGTAVAGIAAASENGTGIMGVAPEAKLAGLRLFGNTDPLNYKVDLLGKQVADALFDPRTQLGQLNRNQSIDIFNNSWGPEYMKRQPLALQALESGVIKGRNGRGNTYVFAGGNEGNFYGNVNYNSFASSRHAIAVGAIDRAGNHASYSTPGSAILVSAASDSNEPNSSQGITTTDIFGNGPGSYANDFGGTSAAAPVVAGVNALMLETNPNLKMRDVEHILVKTAQKNDPNGTNAEGKPKWVQNKAGLLVSYEYGFGAVDAAAAAKAAVNWTPVGKEVKVSSSLQNVIKAIPDGNATGVEAKAAISQNIILEKAEVILNANHSDWGDLTVKLISPDGTESILANTTPDNPNSNNSELAPDSPQWKFTSVRHWGELSKGEWKLQVIDKNNNQFKGSWNTWQLNLYGVELDESPNVVTNTKDSGPGSLREVLTWANSSPGKDTVLFKISPTDPGYNTSNNAFTIRPLSPLPWITDSVIIDGTSQPGYSARPVIELDGSNVSVDGLYISAGNSTVRGLTINRFGVDAIRLIDNGGNILEGNFIGTDVTGTQDLGNGYSGISVWSPNNTIGGTTVKSRNIISGNERVGIYMEGASASNNLIQGNYIGSEITGTQKLGNTNGGIFILGAPNNTIGGTAIGASNLIFGNGRNGVYLTGASATGNAILSNSLFGSEFLGIDLGDNGLTVNDVGDNDTGSNKFQNFPELTSAISSSGNTTIKGKINSTPNITFRVEFFSNKVLDDSGFGGGEFGSGGFGGGGYGEGEKFLGFQNVTTDSSGNATFDVNLPVAVTIGQFITATATDPNNNTSEFSKNFEVKANSEPQLQWVGQTGTSLDEVGRDIATDSAGNVYMVGYTGEGDITFGNWDTLLTKYDSKGNKLWQKQLTDPTTDGALGVKIDATNNVYLVGYTNTSSHADAYIYKYDSNGNEIWKQVFSSQVIFADMGDYATGVDIDNTGNIYVAGNTWGSFDPTKPWPRIPHQNAFIAKYDTNGNQVWIKDFGTDKDENVRAVTTDNAGNSYIVGHTSGSLGVRVDGVDAFIAKYDTNGNQVWLRQFGTLASDAAYGVKVDSGGNNIYVTGSTRGNLNGNNNSGGADNFVVKYDSKGNQLWTNQFGTVDSENLLGVSLDKNGDIYVAGQTKGSLDGNTNAGNYDIFVTKLDSNGVRSWSQQLGTAGEEIVYKLLIDDANNIYITGSASGSLEGQPNAGSSDAVLLKYKIG
jgi:subtilisin family serine protease